MGILQYFVEFILANCYKQQHFTKFIFPNRGQIHKIKFNRN